MKGFDLLEQKYGDPALYLDDPAPAEPNQAEPDQNEPGHNEQPRQLTHWRDSYPVVLLSAFLKEEKHQGFHLQVTREGMPVIYFWPALKDQDKDPERYYQACHAWDLLERAEADLKYLILHGLITLPQNKWI